MTTPTTNIGLSHIQTEFGGSNPIALSEYYAGGAYVPTGQKNVDNVTVPSSGTISIGNLKGATKVTFAASLPTALSGGAFAISTVDAVATLSVNTNGTWSLTSDLNSPGTWKTGSGTGSDYDVRLTQTASSGLSISGTLATWLNLATTRNWTLNENRNGFFTSTFTGTLEIRMAAAPNTVLDSASVYIECVVEI